MYKGNFFCPRLWTGSAVLLVCLSMQSAYADISGKVFRDFNANGTFDAVANEAGMAGVTVKAFAATDPVGTPTAIASSGLDGSYTLAGLAAGVSYRLEFSWAGRWLKSGAAGGTSVQFAQDGATAVNLAVASPTDYCEANPQIASSAFTSGLASGTGSANSLYFLKYDGTALTPHAAKSVTGSVWGLANEPVSKKLFSAAFLKRHVGLGPAGLGGVYVTDYAGAIPTTSLLIDLDSHIDVGTIDDAARGLANAGDPSHDAEALAKIGKVGLGDLDIAADGKTLYVVNLNTKRIQTINITNYLASGTLPGAADVGALPAYPAPACPVGTDRPFALKVHDGKLYAGLVCDAVGGTAADLRAMVYAYDLGAGSWGASPVLTVNSLDYARGNAYYAGLDPSGNPINGLARFAPWSDTMAGAPWTPMNPPHNQIYQNADGWMRFWIGQPETRGHFIMTHPQPMFSDIEFDAGGQMVLALMDRAGHQGGFRNYSEDPADGLPWDASTKPLSSIATAGDVLRAKPEGDGTFTLEAAGTLEGNGCAAVGTGGPGGGEYYCADAYQDSVALGVNGTSAAAGNIQNHDEVIYGGLALLPLDGSVVMSTLDPVAAPDPALEAFSGGVRWLDNETGLYRRAVMLQGDAHQMGKAAGIGDVELLCGPAPIEVGNRVWLDADKDGIQDAGEGGIDGVAVTLTCPGNNVTTTTAGGGYFLFSNAAGGNAGFMVAGSACTISVANVQAAVQDYTVTTLNADGQALNDPFTDLRDSDATVNGSNVEVAFTVGAAGENNHSLDIGYKSAPVTDIALAKTVAPATVRRGGEAVYTLTVQNQSTTDASGVVVSEPLPAGVSYVSDDGQLVYGADVFDEVTGLWGVGNVPAGESKILHVTVRVN